MPRPAWGVIDTACRGRDGERAVSPVVGVTLLLAVTFLLGATVLASLPAAPSDAAATTTATFDLCVTADGRLRLVHAGGDTVDVRELSVRVRVDGQSLSHQPPVPFFAAPGFRAGPTGPFNVAGDPRWGAGEAAAVRTASTNAPALSVGDRVRVALFLDDRPLWTGTTRVESEG